MSPEEITACRICRSESLAPVLNLGRQALTGVFPRTTDDSRRGPIELVFCATCGLVQLRHHYDLTELYGDNYGYRSGLNASMVRHLREKANRLQRLRPLRHGELVIDIGSNDGTLLRAYPEGATRVGFDPSGQKFRQHYPEGALLIPEFFAPRPKMGTAAIITSIAMFYDLPDPRAFVADVAASLAPEGIWHFEQSYLPAMLRTGSYDTVVAEHLEYYSLAVVVELLNACGLRVLDVETNNINGGSFAVTAAHRASRHPSNDAVIEWLLQDEARMGLDRLAVYREFEDRAYRHRDSLCELIRALRSAGREIVGCGASTKGNCLLQFCGFTDRDITAIGDVNPEKWGGFTPGSGIPIVSEEEARGLNPDYMLVPVWHFRGGIIEREAEFLARGGKLIFPFPHVDIVG